MSTYYLRISFIVHILKSVELSAIYGPEKLKKKYALTYSIWGIFWLLRKEHVWEEPISSFWIDNFYCKSFKSITHVLQSSYTHYYFLVFILNLYHNFLEKCILWEDGTVILLQAISAPFFHLHSVVAYVRTIMFMSPFT